MTRKKKMEDKEPGNQKELTANISYIPLIQKQQDFTYNI